MNPLIGGIKRGIAGLKKAGGLILPVFAKPGDFGSLSPPARVALRLVALATGLVALRFVNSALGLERFIVPSWPFGGVRSYWLPLLFFLAFTFCWLVTWLWGQLGSGRDEASFPDIDRAWREAVTALDRAGISINELPMFLVLGRPQGPEGALFDGAELLLKVRGQPDRDDAPIRVYANREAIYLTCAEASVLGRQAAILGITEFEAPVPAASAGPGASGMAFETNYQFMTYDPTAAAAAGGEEGAIMARAQQAGRGPEQLHLEELRALGRLAADRDEPVAAAPRYRSLRESAEVSLQEVRLRHLGRLVARDRRPFCPINGILLLIPLHATNNDQAASLAGQLCRRDLEAVRDSMQVRCPIFAMVCDLESLPGFQELIRRLPDDQKRRRMGQRFPFIPDVDRSAVPALLENAVRWIAHRLLPAQVTSLWRVESVADPAAGGTLPGNILLYQLLGQVRERHSRLARILSHAVLADEAQPAMLGGCYLAATGPNRRSEQAFIPGVFRRLVESQDLVSWTPELLAREARYGRWASAGYVALGLLVALAVGLVVLRLFLR